MVGDLKVGREWVDMPEGAVLPAGLDIDIDMQTGKKRIRIPSHTPGRPLHALAETEPIKGLEDDGAEEFSPLAQRKWERKYEAVHKTAIDTRLEELVSPNAAIAEGAMAYLDEHAHSVDIGAGLVKSRSFPILLSCLADKNLEKRLGAADILFACIQNNPDAIAGITATDTIQTVVSRLGVEKDTTVLKRLLSSLIYIVRGDKKDGSTKQCVEYHLVKALAALSKRMPRETYVVDRILVLLIELVESRWEFVERDSALVLLEGMLGKLTKPYSDWMLHPFRPFCGRQPVELKGRPAFAAFCADLNANPYDTSLLQ